MYHLTRQQGHAAILFVLIVPALFGLFSISTDGARALQSKARLDDSLEAASLAVAAHNDDNEDDGSGSGSAINQQIATSYINAYIGSLNSIKEVKITKQSCEQIPDCVDGLADGEARFFEYRVTASIDHNTWFTGDLSDFNDTFDVGASSTSRKYQNHAVDVAFVSDFSGSMNNGWSGGGQRKYQDLVDVIEAVTVELQKFNNLENMDDNTVSFVGFNNMVRQVGGDGGSGVCYVEQLSYRSGGDVDYRKTMRALFDEKNSCADNTRAGSASFYDIPPTTNFSSFNTAVGNFYPGGWTASFQGIIRGAQMLDKGANPRRLMVVLSDGADYGSTNKSISNNLVNPSNDMCDVIRAHFDAMMVGDDQVSSKIAVIGFDYDVASNAALQTCAGTNNVYKAENKSEILNRILELISEEIGHLK